MVLSLTDGNGTFGDITGDPRTLFSTVSEGINRYFDSRDFKTQAEALLALRALEQDNTPSTGSEFQRGGNAGGIVIGGVPQWALVVGAVAVVGGVVWLAVRA